MSRTTRTAQLIAFCGLLASQANAEIPCLSGGYLRIKSPESFFVPSGVLVVHDPAFQNPTALTIDVSFHPFASGFARIVSKGDGLGFETDRAYDLGLNAAGHVEVNLFLDAPSGPAWTSLTSQSPVATDSWHRMTVTFDSALGEARLYLDGLIEAITNSDSGGVALAGMTIRQSTHDLGIGSTPAFPSTSFAGGIDELRIWNRWLTAAEVALAGVPASAPENGLTALFPFDGHIQNLIGFQYTALSGGGILKGACAKSAVYGSAAGGANGAPELSLSSLPVISSPLSFQVTNPGGASTVALFAVGLVPQKVPLFSGHLYLSPFTSAVIPLLGPQISIPTAVPNDPAIALTPVFLQILAVDSTAPGGVSISRGLALLLGVQ